MRRGANPAVLRLYDPTEASRSYVRFDPLGPVLAVIPHDGDDDAVRIANDSDYGLYGYVWTGDTTRAMFAFPPDMQRIDMAGT